MQLALLADVHANLEALDAVLRDIDKRAPHAAVVCAGDVVGYGPEPDACIGRLRDRDAAFIMGNHEEMVLGRRDLTRCVRAGILAAAWTREHLSRGARSVLQDLPPWLDVAPGVVACHGDLRSADCYVHNAQLACCALGQLGQLRPGARLLVCGHTHRAMFFGEGRGLLEAADGRTIDLSGTERCLINPGSVGQARHGEPLARYALLDLERQNVSYLALPYDHATTERKLRQRGLVPRVVLTEPRSALARRIEHLKTKWVRLRVRLREQRRDPE
jgi:predicted phosphodiesterase